jgi:hypothetical protein
MSDTCGIVVEHCIDGEFHLVYVPAIDKYTQARFTRLIAPMARELFAETTGIPLDEVYVIMFRKHAAKSTT